MTPQERRLIDDLFDRLAALENSPRDPDAEKAIIEGCAEPPMRPMRWCRPRWCRMKRSSAPMPTSRNWKPRLTPSLSSRRSRAASWISMRDAVFGQGQSRGSVPSVRSADSGAQRGPVWNSGQVLGGGPSAGPAGYSDPRNAGYAAPPSPGVMGGGGGSFLGTAAAAAAGVVGGSLLMNSISRPDGRRPSVVRRCRFAGGGLNSPWGGSDQSGGSLARDAGLNDIGNNDRGDDSRQGLFDRASNDDRDNDNDANNNNGDLDNDDDGFDSDDGNGGSDYV